MAVSVRHRLVLLCCSLLTLGNYFCYDTPASLGSHLQAKLGSSADTFAYQINLLYTVYAVPNIFLPLVGGYLMDCLGSSVMILVFSSCVCAGQLLFALGLKTGSF